MDNMVWFPDGTVGDYCIDGETRKQVGDPFESNGERFRITRIEAYKAGTDEYVRDEVWVDKIDLA